MRNMMIVNSKAERRMQRKGNRFVAGAVLATVVLLISATAQAATVYHNVFDGADRGDNPGIGGGMVRFLGGGNPWIVDTDTDQLLGNTSASLNRGCLYTIENFDLSGGFRLEVTFLIGTTSTSSTNRVHFGIMDADRYEYTAIPLRNAANVRAIGLNMTPDFDQGLIYSLEEIEGERDSELVFHSNDQDILEATMQTWVLEVDGAGENWSYSIGGNPPTTGTFAEGEEFDFSRDYRIFGWCQGEPDPFIVDSVKLTVIPEPASMALLGLGSVVMLSVRRRR